MGSFLGKQMQGIMDENLKKQQQFMLTTQQMQVNATCLILHSTA